MVVTCAARYTDFLVNEILPSGEVLHLRDVPEPWKKDGQQNKQRKEAAEGTTAEKEKNGDEQTEKPSETPKETETTEKPEFIVCFSAELQSVHR